MQSLLIKMDFATLDAWLQESVSLRLCDGLEATKLQRVKSMSPFGRTSLEAILRNADPRGMLVELLPESLEGSVEQLLPCGLSRRLLRLLLHRVPTVSRTSAYEFVDAYLQHEGQRAES